jgi:hypothetical protein
MAYSERQQQIIRTIAEYGNISIVEFLLTLTTERTEVEGQQWQELVTAEPNRYHLFIPQFAQRNTWLLFGINPDSHEAIVDYLSIVHELSSRKLLYILPDPKRHIRASAVVHSFNAPMVTDRDRAAVEIDALLQTTSDVTGLSVYAERVYALPSLNDYIANGFVTNDEKISHQQFLVLTDKFEATIAFNKKLLTIASVIGFLTLCALVWNIIDDNISHREVIREITIEERIKPDTNNTQASTILRDTVIIHDTVATATKSKDKAKKKKKRK